MKDVKSWEIAVVAILVCAIVYIILIEYLLKGGLVIRIASRYVADGIWESNITGNT